MGVTTALGGTGQIWFAKDERSTLQRGHDTSDPLSSKGTQMELVLSPQYDMDMVNTGLQIRGMRVESIIMF